ncbi:MAG: folate family ECF transporter S component [Bacillota bacterium]
MEDREILKIKSPTKAISYTAIFTALTFVLNYVYIPFGGMFGVSFVTFSCFLAGILLGPFLGFAVGGLADLLGCIALGYPPNIFILLGSAFWGFFVGGAYRYLKVPRIFQICIGGVVAYIVCSLFLNTYGLYTYTSGGDTFLAYMIARIPVQFTNFTCNLLFTIFFVDLLERRGIV